MKVTGKSILDRVGVSLHRFRVTQSLAVLGVVLLGGTPAMSIAQDVGVTASSITIGRITPRGSTLFAAMAKQRTEAADAYIASVNAAGGVHGRRIIIKDRDDGYQADQALVEAKASIHGDRVFALLGAFGSPTLPVIMKEAEQARVPLVGAVALANDAREPVKKYVFPVRTSSLNETASTVAHQSTIGIRSFVVLHSREAYGPDGAAAYLEALKRANVKPLDVIGFGVKDDPAEIAQRIHAAGAQALLVSALPKPFGAVLKHYRALGGAAQAIGFSAMRLEDLQAELGDLTRGLVVSQAVPPPTRTTVPLVAEFTSVLAKHAPGALPSYHGLDAYMEAKVLVEGLRAAGKQLTRERLVAALESMRNQNFGGVVVRYGPTDRTGSTYVDVVLVSTPNKVTH